MSALRSDGRWLLPTACSAIFLLALLSPRAAFAVRPSYGTATESTVNVDPSGVNCTTTPGSCFKIHYVTTGTDAVSTTDGNGNGVPDYIDTIRTVAADVYAREITGFGWPAPPSDASSTTNGGDGRVDVYVRTVGCNVASVTREGAVSPGSGSWYSYMSFDVDVLARYVNCHNSGPGNLSTMSQLEAVEDVFAHEYHHNIQVGMNALSSTPAFREASANWMNDEAYDDLNVNVRSSKLGDFTLFSSPGTTVDNYTGGYGGWFWLRYLSERFGHAFIRGIWEGLAASSTTNPTAATSAALVARGTTLRDAFTDFTGKLYAKRWFEEGASYPDIRPSGIVNGGSPFASYPVGGQTANLDHLGRAYYQFNAPTPATIGRALALAVDGPNGQDSGAVVILETASGARIDARVALDGNNDGSYRASGFASSPPPTEASSRVTSVILGLANATQASNALSFAFCAGGSCALQGGADPSILPWGAAWGNVEPLWQSVDVWVDNDANCLPNAAGRPGCNEPDDPTTTPVDAEPSKGIANNLVARIRNLGDAAASNVTVRFRYMPVGMGFPDSSFALIGTTTVNLAAAGDTAGGDVALASVNWDLSDLTFNNGGLWDVPSTSGVESVGDFDHFCVRVSIEHSLDANLTNNDVQNNFGNVPSAGTSGRAQFLVVGGKDELPSEMRFSGLPRDWKLDVEGAKGPVLFIAPGEMRLVRAAFSGPPREKLREKQDVVADMSLWTGGQRVSGISFRLAEVNKRSDKNIRFFSALRPIWSRFHALDARLRLEEGRKDADAAARKVLSVDLRELAAEASAATKGFDKDDPQVAQSVEALRRGLEDARARMKRLAP